jgi:hypothetical protein
MKCVRRYYALIAGSGKTTAYMAAASPTQRGQAILMGWFHLVGASLPWLDRGAKSDEKRQ